MTQQQFDRHVTVNVGLPGAEGFQIDNLRIAFDVTKSSEPTPNMGVVRVFNLSKTTREQFAERENELNLTLKTGYRNQTEITLIGNTTKIISTKEGPNVITRFEVGDGQKNITDKTTSTSFGPGFNLTGVIDLLASQLGFPIKTKIGLKSEVSNTGEVLSGSTAKLLTQYLNKQDLEWFVDNCQLVIKPPREPINEIDIVVLTGDSGILNIAERKDFGVEFTALHNPQLQPGKIVKVVSGNVDGFFICRKVTHRGDSREGEFVSIVEAIDK